MKDRGTWVLVEPNEDDQVLPGKWVLDVKLKPNGDILRLRARWVVCGNYEASGDWEVQDVYSAVANSAVVRLFFWLVAIFDLDCDQYDMVVAFLNASIPDGVRVLVKQPTGYNDGTNRACLLKNALYGLTRSPLWWFQTLAKVLKKLGFELLARESCLFRNRTTGALILLYVDDLLIASKGKAAIEITAKGLEQNFELKALGPVYNFLGIEVIRDR